MFKKLLFIFLAGLILVTLLGTDATAGCKIRKGKLVCSDLTTETEITGVNVKRDPTLCTAIFIGYANAWRLTNKPGNSFQSVSHIFEPDTLPENITNITKQDLIDRGHAEVFSTWDWDKIWQWVAQGLGAPNRNWKAVGTNCIDDVYVGMYVYQEDPKVLSFQDSYCLRCTTDCEEAWSEDCPDRFGDPPNCDQPPDGPDGEPTEEGDPVCASNNSGYGLNCDIVDISYCNGEVILADEITPGDAGISLFDECNEVIY